MAITATATVQIADSVEQVFAALTDPTRFHEWQSGMTSSDTDNEPTRVGSRMHGRRTIAGMTVPFTSEITRWEPPHLMAFKSVRTPLRVTGEYRVDSSAGGSLVTATMSIAHSRFSPLQLGGRAENMIAAQLTQDLDAFAQLCEMPAEQDRPTEQ